MTNDILISGHSLYSLHAKLSLL